MRANRALFLPSALDISKKTDLTSSTGVQSKDLKISWVMTNNWFTVESPARKPACLLEDLPKKVVITSQ